WSCSRRCFADSNSRCLVSASSRAASTSPCVVAKPNPSRPPPPRNLPYFVESVQALFVSLLEFGQVLFVGLQAVLRDGLRLDGAECGALRFQLLLLLWDLLCELALLILARLEFIAETLLL